MEREIAVAMLERDGRWLLQLRDDIEGIVYPGTWGLFGGHLDPGESAEQGLRRELLEEIGFGCGPLRWWLAHRTPERVLHVFQGQLTVPLEDLVLHEGQDITLATREELQSGQIHSPKLGVFRPLAPSLRMVVSQLDS